MSDPTYRELLAATNELRHDLTRNSHASKFAASANKASIDKIETRLEKVEERLRTLGKSEELGSRLDKMEDRLRELEKNEAVTDDRIKGLIETKKEHTGKIANLTVNDARDIVQAEKTKAQWGLYAGVVVAVISGLASLVVQLLKMLQGGE